MLLKWSSDPLGKQRPLLSAGRFHLPNSARILYLADEHQTAEHEVQAFGTPLRAIAIVPVNVNLNAVLDLTDGGIRGQIGLTEAELALNFRTSSSLTPTQLLGECCASMGIVDGLLFPSVARRGGVCLAVIETALARLGSSVVVDDHYSGLHDQLP
jgi:RES domain-containing protein